MRKVLLLASNNQKKVKEIKDLLPDFEVKSLAEIGCNEDIPETANTFEGNALLKAEYLINRFQLPCISDDSGLVVEALNGAPGIYSARYAGEEKSDDKNMDKLLSELKEKSNRNAYFTTVLCYHDGKNVHYFEGRIHGTITTKKIGTQGFGYDPIFTPNGSNKTFAQLSPEEKNANSHRGNALKKFIEFVEIEKTLKPS